MNDADLLALCHGLRVEFKRRRDRCSCFGMHMAVLMYCDLIDALSRYIDFCND